MCMCSRQRRRKGRERGSHLGVGFCLGCSCVLPFVFDTMRTQMLQKMGKVDDTKDESFQRYVTNFNAQHVSCTLPYLVCVRLDSAVLVGSLLNGARARILQCVCRRCWPVCGHGMLTLQPMGWSLCSSLVLSLQYFHDFYHSIFQSQYCALHVAINQSLDCSIGTADPHLLCCSGIF